MTIQTQEAKETLDTPSSEGSSTEIDQHIRSAVEPRGVQVKRMLLRDVALPAPVAASDSGKARRGTGGIAHAIRVAQGKTGSGRKKIEAEGISSFQKIVTEGINENLLKWKGIEATRDLASSNNSKVVIIGSDKEGLPVILVGDIAEVSSRPPTSR